MPLGVTQVFHVNVNCSDLDAALTFYRDRLGLTTGVRTRPAAPQDGTAFRLDAAQWDAWVLHDERGLGAGCAIDLLEWQVPEPVGRPARADEPGWNRIGFFVADLDARYEALVADGRVGHGGPPHETTIEGGAPVRTVVVDGPDGVLVELVQTGVDRVGFVAVGVTDLDRAVAFYTEVLGFRLRFRRGPLRQPGDQLGLPGEIGLAAAYLDDPRGDGSFMLEVVQLLDPAPRVGAPRPAHGLGLFRLALLTDDVARDHAELVRLGVPCWSPPVELVMGPGLPPVRALLFEDPDGTVLELIQAPDRAG